MTLVVPRKFEPKKFSGAPFGIQTVRFDVAGVHPDNKKPGAYTQVPYFIGTGTALGPGSYEVDVGAFDQKTLDRNAEGPGWARQYAMERIAALPYLLYKEQWEEKRMQKRKLGPGTYEYRDFMQLAEKPRSTKGMLDSSEIRFRQKHANATPGPGTYGKGGIPHTLTEEKNHQSASTTGMLSTRAKCDRSLPLYGCPLGPGTYPFKSSVDDVLKDSCSKRGPYDTFSEDRGKPMKTGHHARGYSSNLSPGQYPLGTFLDELGSKEKKKHGEFSKCDQHPEKPCERVFAFTLRQYPRRPSEPGPSHYKPNHNFLKKPPSQAKKSPPFLSSAVRNDKFAVKFFTGNSNPVGPGRYDIQKWHEKQHRNGQTSTFKSKSERPNHARAKFLQERIREKDVLLKDRIFITAPENPFKDLLRPPAKLDRTPTQDEFVTQRAVTVA
ncbi:hypothetical protein NP493_255g04008 [Ridgeia piscesae]|uniref:Uncharacterized protein n=1 Tax=Ridgeia piscesae TaxID=27915 RepID=A0AAD9NYG3_RIDPI|nr:hypothetical protein NP493_255g04008 [Ridgeia piscesae]